MSGIVGSFFSWVPLSIQHEHLIECQQQLTTQLRGKHREKASERSSVKADLIRDHNLNKADFTY